MTIDILIIKAKILLSQILMKSLLIPFMLPICFYFVITKCSGRGLPGELSNLSSFGLGNLRSSYFNYYLVSFLLILIFPVALISMLSLSFLISFW